MSPLVRAADIPRLVLDPDLGAAEDVCQGRMRAERRFAKPDPCHLGHLFVHFTDERRKGVVRHAPGRRGLVTVQERAVSEKRVGLLAQELLAEALARALLDFELPSEHMVDVVTGSGIGTAEGLPLIGRNSPPATRAEKRGFDLGHVYECSTPVSRLNSAMPRSQAGIRSRSPSQKP